MPRKYPLTEEEQRLKNLIRQAHEAVQALNAAVREASKLEPKLVSEFQQIHHREIKQLSNYLVDEGNRQSAILNAEVERARREIHDQIMSGAAVFDRETETVTITWGPGKFDSNMPLPYPHEPLWKDTK